MARDPAREVLRQAPQPATRLHVQFLTGDVVRQQRVVMRRSRPLPLDALPRRAPVRVLGTPGAPALERPVAVAGTPVPLELPGTPLIARTPPVTILGPPITLAAGTRTASIAALTGPTAELAVPPGAALPSARPTLTVVPFELARPPLTGARTPVIRTLERAIGATIIPISRAATGPPVRRAFVRTIGLPLVPALRPGTRPPVRRTPVRTVSLPLVAALRPATWPPVRRPLVRTIRSTLVPALGARTAARPLSRTLERTIRPTVLTIPTGRAGATTPLLRLPGPGTAGSSSRVAPATARRVPPTVVPTPLAVVVAAAVLFRAHHVRHCS
ncbi:hypothetical protein GCM10010182_64230 [Actinomadura cremea]|nr:hypothetical protein GCM10010182_64230 [Actinomadura cremea]